MRHTLQHYEHGKVVADFTDRKQNAHATKAHPRDIRIVEVRQEGKALRLRQRDLDTLKEAIAIDIRLGQGFPEVGVAKGLLFK